jgi:hypothetical protein
MPRVLKFCHSMRDQDQRQCQWRSDEGCQFSTRQDKPLVEYQGKQYCAWHLPLEAPNRPTIPQEELSREPNLRGVQFPAGHYVITGVPGAENARDMTRCRFAHGVSLGIGQRVSLDHSEFLGDTRVISHRLCTAMLRHVTARAAFKVRAESSSSESAVRWSFAGAEFHGPVDFSKASFDEQVNLDGVTFHAPVNFDGSCFPQQTSAVGVKFKKGAIDRESEGSYRYARTLFANHRNRELEGKFFALEKRCARKSIPWWSFGAIVSWLYDIASEYGSNYVRAFVGFICVQVVAALGYSVAAGRFVPDWTFDRHVWIFTLSQVVKPFELLSAREPNTAAFRAIVGSVDHAGWLTFWTVLHSVASLTLVALFLLAIRWRFRREG